MFVALLMAVSIPSSALAWESSGQPDAVLTVSVNMGSSDAGDGDGGGGEVCSGFATMQLSASVLESRPDRVEPAVSTPSIQQRLAALATPALLGYSLSLNDTFNSERVFTRSQEVSGSWVINSDWIQNDNDHRIMAEELAQLDLSNFDFGAASVSFSDVTPSLAMIDRRTYVTSPFTVSYDATSCESDGDARAGIYIERTELEARTTVNGEQVWNSVELPLRNGVPPSECCYNDEAYEEFIATSIAAYNVGALREVAADGLFKGEAYILKSRTASDGDRRLSPVATRPYSEFNYDEVGLYGSSGEATLRAVTKLYGELSQNAQLRTQYGFWMEVYPYGN